MDSLVNITLQEEELCPQSYLTSSTHLTTIYTLDHPRIKVTYWLPTITHIHSCHHYASHHSPWRVRLGAYVFDNMYNFDLYVSVVLEVVSYKMLTTYHIMEWP